MPKPYEISQLGITDGEVTKLFELCKDSQPLRFDDEEYLFRENDKSDYIYIVVRGAVVIEQQRGRRKPEIIATYCIDSDEPRFIGEMAYYGSGLRSATVRSTGATYTLALKPEHVEVVFEKLPTFTRILCQQFTQRIKDANDFIKEINAANTINTKQIDLGEGQILFEQGAKADKLYHLVFGELQWERDGQTIDGQPLLEFIEPAAYFSDAIYPVTVRAKTLSCLVEIDQASKEGVVRCYPQLVLKLFDGQ